MRNQGGLSMSIGTSLAFEGTGGQSLGEMESFLFNLSTLIRNAHAAYETDDKEANDPSQLAEDVANDLRGIADLIRDRRKGKPSVMVVYLPDYSPENMKSNFRYADLKTKKSDKQKAYDVLAEKVANKVISKFGKLIVKVRNGIPAFSGKGVVVTHHAVDLVFTEAVARLYLLESYTGALKPFTLWYTKFTSGEELNRMPFNRLTIQVFGDRSVHFKVASQGIKAVLKQLAIDHHWTGATSMSRVRAHVNALPESVDREGLKLMM